MSLSAVSKIRQRPHQLIEKARSGQGRGAIKVVLDQERLQLDVDLRGRETHTAAPREVGGGGGRRGGEIIGLLLTLCFFTGYRVKHRWS